MFGVAARATTNLALRTRWCRVPRLFTVASARLPLGTISKPDERLVEQGTAPGRLQVSGRVLQKKRRRAVQAMRLIGRVVVHAGTAILRLWLDPNGPALRGLEAACGSLLRSCGLGACRT